MKHVVFSVVRNISRHNSPSLLQTYQKQEMGFYALVTACNAKIPSLLCTVLKTQRNFCVLTSSYSLHITSSSLALQCLSAKDIIYTSYVFTRIPQGLIIIKRTCDSITSCCPALPPLNPPPAHRYRKQGGLVTIFAFTCCKWNLGSAHY